MAREQNLFEDEERQDGMQDILGDIGNFDIPDIDIDLPKLDFMPSDETEETRYTLPHLVHYNEEDFVLYENAVKLAKELKVKEGMRADAFIAGSFIFGDFIEAFMTTHNVGTKKMTISTLSMSEENVDSLRTLMEKGYVEELNLIISVYFWGHERHAMLPYIYEQLDIDNRFQLAIVIHGSANLRSSGSIEQFTIEENPKLHDFYEEQFSKILDKYATIKKPIRNSKAWDIFTKKYFKD